MSPLAKLGSYAAVLVLALVVGLALGATVGPIDVGGDGHAGDPAPLQHDRDHGWGS